MDATLSSIAIPGDFSRFRFESKSCLVTRPNNRPLKIIRQNSDRSHDSRSANGFDNLAIYVVVREKPIALPVLRETGVSAKWYKIIWESNTPYLLTSFYTTLHLHRSSRKIKKKHIHIIKLFVIYKVMHFKFNKVKTTVSRIDSFLHNILSNCKRQHILYVLRVLY